MTRPRSLLVAALGFLAVDAAPAPAQELLRERYGAAGTLALAGEVVVRAEDSGVQRGGCSAVGVERVRSVVQLGVTEGLEAARGQCQRARRTPARSERVGGRPTLQERVVRNQVEHVALRPADDVVHLRVECVLRDQSSPRTWRFSTKSFAAANS